MLIPHQYIIARKGGEKCYEEFTNHKNADAAQIRRKAGGFQVCGPRKSGGFRLVHGVEVWYILGGQKSVAP